MYEIIKDECQCIFNQHFAEQEAGCFLTLGFQNESESAIRKNLSLQNDFRNISDIQILKPLRCQKTGKIQINC